MIGSTPRFLKVRYEAQAIVSNLFPWGTVVTLRDFGVTKGASERVYQLLRWWDEPEGLNSQPLNCAVEGI